MFNIMPHQEVMADTWVKNGILFNQSDPGTSKTVGAIHGFNKFNTSNKRLLVLAPLSILKASWADDIQKYEGFSYSIAHGSPKKRREAFELGADIVIMNHDGVNWLVKNMDVMESITHVVIDESTAFKNANTQRSKALVQVTRNTPYIQVMSGTPIPKTILDIWHQVFLLDRKNFKESERLGLFYQFRNTTCDSIPVPGINTQQWMDRPGAEEFVADKIKDISVRFRLEDCIEIPEHQVIDYFIPPPKWLMDQYKELEKTSFLELDNGSLTPINAAVRAKKLLQLLSGAVYDESGRVLKVHEERYKLVLELVTQRKHSLVAFNYRHEVENLVDHASKQNISYAIIDGSIRPKKRTEAVRAFQAGDLQTIFAHPQSAGHGLTMTKGTTTIWTSPTYNAEHYKQFNHRIYRNGQRQRTQTINVGYEGTKEVLAYANVSGKLENQHNLLDLMFKLTPQGVAHV